MFSFSLFLWHKGSTDAYTERSVLEVFFIFRTKEATNRRAFRPPTGTETHVTGSTCDNSPSNRQ